jgi:zinc protease
LKKRSLILAIIFSILLFDWTAHAMNVFSLDNGLQYIFEQRKDTGVVAIQVWVKVGSKYEEPERAGITHFIEHLIFKGTEKVKANEMASRIESLGGVVNAYTSYDNTVYHIIVPKSAFEEGFELLVDAVRNPAFPETEVVKEKRVVLEEIKMGEDDPQRKLFNELFSLSYRGHPYGRPVIGFADTVKNIGRDDILTYFGAHYTPDNMMILIAGDFDEKKAAELIRKHAGGNRGSIDKTLDKNGDDRKKGGREKTIEKNVRESYLALSYRIPSMVHEDTPALEILGTILGDGESSRLQQQLKNKAGLVTNSATYAFTPKEEGLFVIYATFKGRDFGPIKAEIGKEVTRLKEEGPTPWEIKKAKNMIRASYVYSAETVQGRARQIGNFHTLTGDPQFIDKFLAKIDSVTAEDIKRITEKYIVGKDSALVTLLPKKPSEPSNPYTFKLKNGLTCVVNKNPASPSLAFRVGFVGGVKEEAEGKNGTFNLVSRMLLKGTKEKNATKIAEEIDFLAGDISPFSGKNIFGLSGRFLSKDAAEGLGLLKELLASTVLREEELKKVKEEVLSDIRQRDDDPVRYTFMRFNEILYKGHSYSKDPVGKESDIASLGLDDLEKAYKDFVTPSSAVLAISGNVDEKEMEKLFQKLFSDWSGRTNPLRKENVSLPGKSTDHIQKEIMQTHMIFGFLGPGILDEDRYSIEVLDAILSGMGGRIHKVLREEKPYAYSLTFFNQMALEAGGMGVYLGTDKKLTDEVRKIVNAEIGKIVTEGFTDKEVKDAKTYLIGTHYIQMQANSAIATSMCLDTMYGLKPGYFKVWPGHVKAVKKDDVNRAAKKYLLSEKMVELAVGGK